MTTTPLTNKIDSNTKMNRLPTYPTTNHRNQGLQRSVLVLVLVVLLGASIPTVSAFGVPQPFLSHLAQEVAERIADVTYLQAVFFKDKDQHGFSQKTIKYLKSLTVESIIDIEGTLEDAEVRSCSVQNVEVKIGHIYAVTKAAAILPFLVEDASRSEAEVNALQETDRPFPRLFPTPLLVFHLFSF
jgi:hypothetical protein